MMMDDTRHLVEDCLVRSAAAARKADDAYMELIRLMSRLGQPDSPPIEQLSRARDDAMAADRKAAVQLLGLLVALRDYGALDDLRLGNVPELVVLP